MHKTYAALKGISASKFVIIGSAEQRYTGNCLYYFNNNFYISRKPKSLKTKIQNIIYSIKAMRNAMRDKRKCLVFEQLFPDGGTGFGDGYSQGDGCLDYDDNVNFQGERYYSYSIYYLLYDI